uniref:DUF4272 domain-containing protein n=1 Tax=Vaginimicrobium propionicum TaxID=1871034 RepID=UPI0009712990|nr:DUF4272 domain-containing protein [Vaginimicrobium propionicum]
MIAFSTRRSLITPALEQPTPSRPLWQAGHRDHQIVKQIELAIKTCPTATNHLRATQRVYFLTVDLTDVEQASTLTRWGKESSALLLAGAKILDPAGFDINDPKAEVPVLAERLERAERWRTFLRTKGVSGPIPKPVRCLDETMLQDEQIVGLRMVTLALVAFGAYAASEHSQLPDPDIFPRAKAAMTNREAERYPARNNAQESAECLKELAWATKRAHLDWPSRPGDLLEIVGQILTRDENSFIAETKLRPAEELLDEHERMSQLTAAIATTAKINPEVVKARTKTMAWLTDRSRSWDEVID